MKTPLRIAGTLLVPVAAWICYLFLLAPSLIVVPISFGSSGEMEFPPREWSTALYQEFFADPAWWGSLTRSLVIAVCVMVVTTILVVPAAYALNRARLPGQKIIAALAMGPLLVPVIVLALGLYLQLAPLNMLNRTVTVVLAHTMLAMPFMMVSVGAALRRRGQTYSAYFPDDVSSSRQSPSNKSSAFGWIFWERACLGQRLCDSSCIFR